jgi:hypothetical protein
MTLGPFVTLTLRGETFAVVAGCTRVILVTEGDVPALAGHDTSTIFRRMISGAGLPSIS